VFEHTAEAIARVGIPQASDVATVGDARLRVRTNAVACLGPCDMIEMDDMRN